VLGEVTQVKKSMEHPRHDLTGIVSSITSKHIQRISIGFVDPVVDTRLQSAIESKVWDEFDEAITRLAERTLNNGWRVQLDLHVCGNPSTDLFDLLFPRFVGSGRLKVVKTSYIWTGSFPHLFLLLKQDDMLLPAFISGPSTCGLRRGQEVL